MDRHGNLIDGRLTLAVPERGTRPSVRGPSLPSRPGGRRPGGQDSGWGEGRTAVEISTAVNFPLMAKCLAGETIHSPARGRRWYASTVRNLLVRADQVEGVKDAA